MSIESFPQDTPEEIEARTSETNTDHLISSSLESDPEIYKTVVVRNINRIDFLFR